MNWLLRKLAHLLIGNGLDTSDERLDGLTLAMEEEFAALMAQEPR